jgi:hypothetical protein
MQVGDSKPDPTNSLFLTWGTNVAAGSVMRISIRVAGTNGDFPAPIVQVPAEQGHAVLTGLSPGQTYEIKLVVEFGGRLSESFAGKASTDAIRKRIGCDSGYCKLYTGPLTDDGVPEAESAIIEYHKNDSTKGHDDWIYRGSVRAGLPSGNGRLEADPGACRPSVCGSSCVGTFEAGKVSSTRCALNIATLEVPEGNGRIIYGGNSHYEGQVTAAQEGQPAVRLGPFSVVFQGLGELTAADHTVTYSGRFDGGALTEGKTFKDGVLTSDTGPGAHSRIGQDHCWLRIATVNDPDQVPGPGVDVTCKDAEIGYYSTPQVSVDPLEGFAINYHPDEDFLQARWFHNGKLTWLKRQSTTSAPDCMEKEDMSMGPIIAQIPDPHWELSCQMSDENPSCTLTAELAGLSVIVTRRAGQIPDVRILDGVTGAEPTNRSIVDVDGKGWSIAAPQRQDNATNYELLAAMCSGKKLGNMVTKGTAPLGDFCPRLAILYARILACK